jgi:hypothetical protein
MIPEIHPKILEIRVIRYTDEEEGKAYPEVGNLSTSFTLF